MTLAKKSFDKPDETRPFDGNGRMQVVEVAGTTVGRGIFEPGWMWSKNVKPIAGGESCQANHTGYVVSGRMVIRMADGTEGEAGPGDVIVATAGHDAWVVGNEPCVLVDWTGVAKYAKKA